MRATLYPIALDVVIVAALALAMFSCGDDQRERTYKHQTPTERFRDGLKDPSRHPPGKGFNTD